MSERPHTEFGNRVLMKCLDNYDPLGFLAHLAAQIGYNAGYVIRLSERDRKRIHDILMFHSGKG